MGMVDALGDRGPSRIDNGDPFAVAEAFQVKRILKLQIDIHF
jgi:hypothetical protein